MSKDLTYESLLERPVETIGNTRLACLPYARVHWLAPWPTHEAAFSERLNRVCGLPFPKPGQVLENEGKAMIWAGRDAAFWLGDTPEESLREHGAVIDVSDGWARCVLSGPDAALVLARLCPVDLRPVLFTTPTSLRTEIKHMAVLIIAGREEIEIWGMRSFAMTLYNDLCEAMRAVAARTEIES